MKGQRRCPGCFAGLCSLKHSFPSATSCGTGCALRLSEPKDGSASVSLQPAFFHRCSSTKFKAIVLGLLPVLSWLPKYKIKDYIIPDMLGGLSGGCIQVPQGESSPQPGLAGQPLQFFPHLYPVTSVNQMLS